MLRFRSCAILLCDIVVLLLLLLEAVVAAVAVAVVVMTLLLLLLLVLLQLLLLLPQLMLHSQRHLEVPLLLLWLLLLWLRLLCCPLRCIYACLHMLRSLHCSVSPLECFAYMLRVIFSSGGEVALASTRSILPRGLFGRALLKKALVPFEGHVLIHGKVWTQLMGLTGSNANVFRELKNDRFLHSHQVTLLARVRLSNLFKLSIHHLQHFRHVILHGNSTMGGFEGTALSAVTGTISWAGA
jgi:hypothetical protein